MSAAGSGPRVVLVGPSGSGKSTVGELLGRRLGVGFRDTDADVEVRTGKPVSDIFVQDGEDAFRALERDAVHRALTEHDGVLALGGGSVLDGDTRALLRDHRVAFLDVTLAAAVHRVGLDAPRPLLVVNPRTTLRRMMEERRPLYEAVATIVVQTGDREPPAVVDEIVSSLGEAVPR